MAILIIGVLLWWAAHLFKRVAPDLRGQLGARGKGITALALVASVVLMVIGYRMAQGPYWWGATAALKGINNLIVLVAIWIFAGDGMKSVLVKRLRHPQLTGFALWAAAHLMVNGDLPSVILFGGLLAWSLVEMTVLSRVTPDRRTGPAPIVWRKEIMVAVAALVTFGVIGLIHGWLGYKVFGG